MTTEDKKQLLAELCARLPYGVKVHIKSLNYEFDSVLVDVYNNGTECFVKVSDSKNIYNLDEVRPYLRSMDLMSDDEKNNLNYILNYEFYIDDDFALCAEDDRHRIRLSLIRTYMLWIYRNHFDCQNLIDKGLAIETTAEIYK